MGFIFRPPGSWLARLQDLPKHPLFANWLNADARLANQHLVNRERQRQKNKRELLGKPNNPTATLPVVWAATTEDTPIANLGDALSPVIVSALSGLPVVHQHFDAATPRLACVGTIGHGLKNGTIHLWGTGASHRQPFAAVDAVTDLQQLGQQSGTQFQIHALRGPLTAGVFERHGLEFPRLYGEPVWLLPTIIPPAPEKQYELGIVVHLSELTEYTDTAACKPGFVRYNIPAELAGQVRIITTLTQPTLADLEARVQEITACKRIVSTSLHGLVIAEAYRVPCAYFPVRGQGVAIARLDDEAARVNFRIRDFYLGIGLEQLFVYQQEREQETNWEEVMSAIDRHWEPIEWSAAAFLEAFPLPLAFNPLHAQLGDRTLLQQIKF